MNAADRQIKAWAEEELKTVNEQFDQMFKEEIEAKQQGHRQEQAGESK